MNNYGHYLVEKYGVEVHDIPTGDYETMMRTICEYVDENIPVVITLDTYCCNWYEDFRKDHRKHSFKVVFRID